MEARPRRLRCTFVLAIWAALCLVGAAALETEQLGLDRRRPGSRVLSEGGPQQAALVPDQAAGDQEQLGAARAQRWNATAGALVHGWVRKAGALDPRLFAKSLHKERVAQFNRWLKASRYSHEAVRARRLVQAKTGFLPLPDPPPAVYPGCHVFVNHAYKFIYVRHPKTASTAVLKYFTECPDAEGQDKGAGAAPASCVVRLNSALSGEETSRLFADYFAFTVVRNPYQRMVSSYKFLVAKMKDSEGCREAVAGGLSWDAYCQDPISLGAICHRMPSCCAFPSGFFWHHTLEQAGCLVAGGTSSGGGNSGGWAVDYIARQEYLDADMAEVFAEIDRRRDPALPALSRGRLGLYNVAQPFAHCGAGGDKEVGLVAGAEEGPLDYAPAAPAHQYCEPEQYFAPPHQRCLRTLRHFYSRDFELLYGGPPEAEAAS